MLVWLMRRIMNYIKTDKGTKNFNISSLRKTAYYWLKEVTTTRLTQINSTTMASFEQVLNKVCNLVQTLSGVWKSIQTDNSVISGTSKRGVHVVLHNPSNELNAAVDHSSQLRQERRYQQNAGILYPTQITCNNIVT